MSWTNERHTDLAFRHDMKQTEGQHLISLNGQAPRITFMPWTSDQQQVEKNRSSKIHARNTGKPPPEFSYFTMSSGLIYEVPWDLIRGENNKPIDDHLVSFILERHIETYMVPKELWKIIIRRVFDWILFPQPSRRKPLPFPASSKVYSSSNTTSTQDPSRRCFDTGEWL